MRTIALSALLCSIVLLAADETPLASLANLSTALSENDPDSALSYFDSQMKGYSTIDANLDALTAQTDISCAIDIVTDEESKGVHKLDLDWLMELKSRGDDPQLERRRERVQVEMRQVKGRWKIISMSPLSILDPIHIK
jgi:hypothetical protein